MFQKILLPLPSEYYSEKAIKRAIDIAAKFKSDLIVEYIFGNEVMEKVNYISSGAVSHRSLEDMTTEVKNVVVGEESTVFFNEIEKQAKKRKVTIRKLIQDGIHSSEILDCIKKEDIDLMVTEFHKDSLIDYEIFYESPVPIWLEQNGRAIKTIYGVLTNISPNKLVPGFAFEISKKLDVPLIFTYVKDPSEPYNEVEEKKARERLLTRLKKRCEKESLDYEIEVVTRDISTFLNQEYKSMDTSLVILGRFKKPVRLPFVHLDKKIEISKKLNANVLMLK